MVKNKIMENAKIFLKSCYDYILLFLIISWSGYMEYLRTYDVLKWAHFPCMLNISNIVGSIGYQIYRFFETSIPFIFKLLLAYLLYLSVYSGLKYIYRNTKIKWVKKVLLVLFYLAISLFIIGTYVRCGLIGIGVWILEYFNLKCKTETKSQYLHCSFY